LYHVWVECYIAGLGIYDVDPMENNEKEIV